MDKATQVLGTFKKILPAMSDSDLDRLIAFGQGLAFKTSGEPGSLPLARPAAQGDVRASV